MPEAVIVVPLQPMRRNETFGAGHLPLHLTVLGKVAVDEHQLPALDQLADQVANQTAELTVTAGEITGFGETGTIGVTTVNPSAELNALHYRLLQGAVAMGATPVTPAYVGAGYRPHVTHVGEEVPSSVEFSLTSLVVVDCTQPLRRVTSVAPLQPRI